MVLNAMKAHRSHSINPAGHVSQQSCKNLKAEVGVLRRCFRLRRRSWTRGPASAEGWVTAQDRIEPRYDPGNLQQQLAQLRCVHRPPPCGPCVPALIYTCFGSYNGRYGSHNPSYVNPFVQGIPTPAGLRFSSTVVRGIEIAVFVAKPDPVASDFDRISSLWGGGFRN